jgi:hypothetical protein
MSEAVAGWDTFYVIVGSSAAALTGLMFVVITLTADVRFGASERNNGVDAFASPTVVHFCLVLLLAAVLTSPKHTATTLGASLGVVALIGLSYMVIVLVRMRRVKAYEAVAEDWIWHAILPLTAYLSLGVCSILIWRGQSNALYVVSGAALLLLYIGIHNAWDTATWMAVHGRDAQDHPSPSSAPKP